MDKTTSYVREYFSCICGTLLTARQVRVTCPQCRQTWKSTKNGCYRVTTEVCSKCDGFGAGVELVASSKPHLLVRCDECELFPDDNAALDAVVKAWKVVHCAVETVVDSCRACPFIDDTRQHCKMLHIGVAPYKLLGDIHQVDAHCPLKKKNWVVRLDEKMKGSRAGFKELRTEEGSR